MAEGGDGIQIDKGGFVRIHYEILERLAKAPLTGGEFRCLMFLFRKTYGFNKKEDKISLAQWAEGTGMKRQNVWNILQTLLRRNFIYSKSTGPKRSLTWGFNKHYENWNTESVIPQHDSSVMLDHDSDEMPVMPQHDKSVIPPHERTKDNKDNKAATPILDETNQVSSLVLLAYNTVGKIAPPHFRDDGKANLVIACELIDKYGWEGCVRGISTLKERNNARVLKNARDTIRAPISYLRTILEDEPVEVFSPSTIDFAVGEYA